MKSLRIGWPEGLRQAQIHIGLSKMRGVIACGLFEDVFPAGDELKDAAREAQLLDYEALCRRETHHGRGYTKKFCALEVEAVNAAANEGGRLYHQAKDLGLWLPPRAMNCFYTWLKLKPKDAGVIRKVDRTPWTTMPPAMLDGHTREGRWKGRRMTILSGHYENHLTLSKMVKEIGWNGVRKAVHAGAIEWPK